MEINNKKLETTSKIVNYTISTILCLFLILLSNKIIGDLDQTIDPVTVEQFENQTVIAQHEQTINQINTTNQQLTERKESFVVGYNLSQSNAAAEKESFNNWLKTRKVLGSPDKDEEVIKRAKKIDDLSLVAQGWQKKIIQINDSISANNKQVSGYYDLIEQERAEGLKKYSEVLKQYQLKLFLIRLLFVLPILALGIFFVIKKRRNKFWPLYFGFTLFSVYSFFFGLLPYLPSYGGYIRYSVGLVLSVGLGYYAIKYIRNFVEQKQAELKVSTQERAKKIQTDTAEKALTNHYCPSCGKDFILKKWDFPLSKPNDSDVYKLVSSFCRHCGLELFKDCKSCGTKNFAHLPYCGNCGEGIGKTLV